jgi:hypothetical protein
MSIRPTPPLNSNKNRLSPREERRRWSFLKLWIQNKVLQGTTDKKLSQAAISSADDDNEREVLKGKHRCSPCGFY